MLKSKERVISFFSSKQLIVHIQKKQKTKQNQKKKHSNGDKNVTRPNSCLKKKSIIKSYCLTLFWQRVKIFTRMFMKMLGFKHISAESSRSDITQTQKRDRTFCHRPPSCNLSVCTWRQWSRSDSETFSHHLIVPSNKQCGAWPSGYPGICASCVWHFG